MGFKFYPPDLGVTICRSTEEEYFTQEFLASYMFDLQHSFVSFEGKSAAYNNFNRGSKKVQFFKSFLLHNPTVGRPTPGFCQSIPRTDDKEVVHTICQGEGCERGDALSPVYFMKISLGR